MNRSLPWNCLPGLPGWHRVCVQGGKVGKQAESVWVTTTGFGMQIWLEHIFTNSDCSIIHILWLIWCDGNNLLRLVCRRCPRRHRCWMSCCLLLAHTKEKPHSRRNGAVIPCVANCGALIGTGKWQLVRKRFVCSWIDERMRTSDIWRMSSAGEVNIHSSILTPHRIDRSVSRWRFNNDFIRY